MNGMITKKRIYEVIEASHEGDMVSKNYDIMILVAVIVGLIPLTMKGENHYTRLIDTMTAFIFLIDYVLRVYTSDYKMGIKSYKAYLFYAFTPMAMIDLLSVVPILALVFPETTSVGLFRVVRIFQLLKLVRYSKTMVNITNMVRRVRSQLLAVLILAIIYIFAVAMIMFQLEPDTFPTYFDAVYWSAISITTIGYGDFSPATAIGKALTVVSSLVGVAVIALPSGIITAAYMDEVKREKKGHAL